MAIRKTKIVCTIGPASDSEDKIRELMLSGMNVARMNFSHGTHESHLATLNKIKKIRKELNLPVAALLDTKGPEIRLCDFKDGKIMLEKDQTFTLTSREIEGTSQIASITYKNLVNDVKPGMTILIDDGLIEMQVISVNETDIVCRVLNGGPVSNHKGINVPNCALSMPFISEKDRSDIIFAAENDYDIIAASFTRCAQDILDIRRVLAEAGNEHIMIIAKIENRQGIDNVDEILRVSDGIMVARGDMGVEIPLEEVPILQKLIIRKVYMAGKIAITATQMLESMINNPRPTRAEVTDIANAVYDNTSAVMLSGETAAGKYPVEAVQTMAKIALQTEAAINYDKQFKEVEMHDPDITAAISHACCMTALDLNSSAIITVTKSGFTARMISKHRPRTPIVACCMTEDVCRRLNLSWGVTPMLIEQQDSTDDLFESAVDKAEEAGIVKQGETVVITAGVPLSVSGTTNIIKVHSVGHVLMRGNGVGDKAVSGNLCVARNEESLIHNYRPGSIIVMSQTSNNVMEQLRTAAAIITEEDGEYSHAAVVGKALDIPVIVGAKHAVSVLKPGTFVTVDAVTGLVQANK